jgi:hypothetical protein
MFLGGTSCAILHMSRYYNISGEVVIIGSVILLLKNIKCVRARCLLFFITGITDMFLIQS